MITPKNINDALLPLTISNWIMGIDIMEYPLGHPRSIFSIIYSKVCIVLLSATLSIHYFQYGNYYGPSVNVNNNTLLDVFTYGNILLCAIGIISSKTNAQKLKLCLQELSIVDEQINRIGISEDYSKLFWISIAIIAIINIYLLSLLLIICAKVLILLRYGVIINVVGTLYFTFGIPYIIECRFLYIISYINRKLCQLNDTLCQLSKYDSLQKPKLFYLKIGLIKTIRQRSNNDTKLLKTIRQMHLDLVRISRNINDVFSNEILISIVVSIIVLIFDSYNIVYGALNDFENYPSLVVTLFIFSYYLAKVLTINHICHMACEEVLMTETIVFELQETKADEDFSKEIEDFLLEIRHNRLIFTAKGFFNLNHNLINYIIGTITTYIIIVIQFRPVV